jgi:hypothetical protein
MIDGSHTMANSILTRPPGPHPTPEQLYQARRGPRNAEAERHLAHAALCAECSEEMVRQEAFDHPEEMSSQELDARWENFGPPRTRSTAPVRESVTQAPRLPTVQRFALAAAALLILSMGFGLWNAAQPRPAGPVAGGDTVRGGVSLDAEEFQPVGKLSAPPEEFVFPASAAGGDAPLQVTLYDSHRKHTWTSPPVTGGRVLIPESERRQLRPGVTYYWTVLGNDSASAQTFRIE